MAQRLRDERRRLDEFQAGDLAVRDSFRVSYDNLHATGEGRPARLFQLLGLWGELSISLATAVALTGEPEGDVADALETLVDAHLLESAEPGQYRLHSLLRVYATERAAAEIPADERDTMIRRLRDWRDRDQLSAGPGLPLPAGPDRTAGLAVSPATEGVRGEILQEAETSSHPAGAAAEDSMTEDSQPQAADETVLASLRAILTTQGILGREQAADYLATLIQSWPGAQGLAPEMPVETSGEADSLPTPAPVEVIPDLPGRDQRPDPLTARTPADFREALRKLRQWAGNPSYRKLGKQCGGKPAASTIWAALNDDILPDMDVVRAIVRACGGQEQESAFITAWRELEMKQEPRRSWSKQPAERRLYPDP
jgi:hypothetical protein